MSKSYDLSTSSKWANLADGEHTVKIKAKGTGFGSSSFSNSVTVTKGATGETWVLNESNINCQHGFMDADFISNGNSYTQISFNYDDGDSYMYYNDDQAYYNGFTNTAYRTITFTQPVTDSTLLAWLQANGTKQGVTEHTLTFSNLTSLTVNGSAVTSPYTLQNGDVIVATREGITGDTPLDIWIASIDIECTPSTNISTVEGGYIIQNADIAITGQLEKYPEGDAQTRTVQITYKTA